MEKKTLHPTPYTLHPNNFDHIRVILGLGNPGKEYSTTYHNAGVMALEATMRQMANGKEYREEVGAFKKYKGLFEYVELNGIAFVKPLTYMNESGKAAREALKKFAAKSEQLLVIHDDSDIVIGAYKFSFARGSAGQKGVQSVIDTLKTNRFQRARIGIRPANETARAKAGDFALKQITKRDRATLEGVFAAVARELTS